MSIKRSNLLALIFMAPLCLMLAECLSNKKSEQPDARGDIFAGSASCIKCHKDIYESYLSTAHFNSSRPATMHSVHGSFAAGANVLDFGNGMKVMMERKGGHLYQVGYVHGKKVEAEPFDITIGGVKAETYLYWKGKQLFELPVSYFEALHNWTNSPGYAAGHIDFGRPILRHCLECHSSYIKEIPQAGVNLSHPVTEFDSTSLIYGIDCERCHGPAANHVRFHTEFPNEKKARYITTYASLSRAQKLDACAVCHSGNKQMFVRSAFVFKAGDTLAKFREPDFSTEQVDPAMLDVHGNQSGLLAASKCFMMSNMDCTTCHNVHVKERADLTLYSNKCMQCHNEANHNFCKMAPELGALIKNNCIDCHMPVKPSKVISVEAAGDKMTDPYRIRTHRIAIYPGVTKKVVAMLKAQYQPKTIHAKPGDQAL